MFRKVSERVQLELEPGIAYIVRKLPPVLALGGFSSF